MLLVPDEGEVQALTEYLGNGENWTLKLFKADVTPAEGDTAATYTEADFTGYVAKTINRSVGAGAWSSPTTSVGVTSSTYNSGSPQTWTCTGATGNSIYGYYAVGATSGKVRMVEKFAAARVMAENDSLQLTPRIEVD